MRISCMVRKYFILSWEGTTDGFGCLIDNDTEKGLESHMATCLGEGIL